MWTDKQGASIGKPASFNPSVGIPSMWTKIAKFNDPTFW